MLLLIGDIVCVLLWIFGLVEIIKFLILKLMTIKSTRESFVVLPLEGYMDDIEFILRNEITKVKWSNFYMNKKIICLDCGMDEKTKHICEVITSEYDFIAIYNIQEFESEFG